MMTLVRWLVTRLAVVPWLLKSLGGLAVLVPIALVLKLIGWPVLMVVGVLAVPVLFVLFVLGLPIFLVLLVGGGLMAFVFALLTLGLIVLKVTLFVVLPVYVIVKLVRWIFGRGKGAVAEAGHVEG